MRKLRNILNHVLDVLAGVSFLAMVALTCWQVFTRYILKNPSSWSEELVSYLFAWMSLFGSSIVVGERGHMNIPILVEKMGSRCLPVFLNHSGIRRYADHQSCHGADDFFTGGGSWRLLCSSAGKRRSEHCVYHLKYGGNCKRHHPSG